MTAAELAGAFGDLRGLPDAGEDEVGLELSDQPSTLKSSPPTLSEGSFVRTAEVEVDALWL
ncbi:hypothetical protein [Serinibacter arcticus]|uniref:Uncharacterized protein n=1 Tax=Serinibacter arcticus TaxID=1655435 RepID=A0A4Z1DZK2_9MICO|nr:hypothetical protein [Serinibacter arcticus]TGO03802.1 hypothetical protein SERN_2814 [Serinibacter arcticus]